MTENTTLFARSIGALGKLESELKTKVDAATHELYRRQCAQEQTTSAEDLRDFVYLRVYGVTYTQMIAEKLKHEADRMATLHRLVGHIRAPESSAQGDK